MVDPHRWMLLAAAAWLGLLLSVAGIATPAAFAVLIQADAGRLVGRVLASEAAASVVLGAGILILQRVQSRRRAAQGTSSSQFTRDLALAAGAVFCTLLGYYAIQPMMVEARAGRGALSFGQLHAVSGAFYLAKVALVAVLAWGLSRPFQEPGLEP